MRGGRPRFGQSSDLTSDCRSGQLVEQPGDRMLRSSRPQGLRRSDRMLMSALIRRCQENLSNVSEHQSPSLARKRKLMDLRGAVVEFLLPRQIDGIVHWDGECVAANLGKLHRSGLLEAMLCEISIRGRRARDRR